jgi:tetratricopeptide (TPR) repeat protein
MVRALSDPSNLADVVGEIIETTEFIDSKIFEDLAELCIEKNKYSLAEQLLLKGLQVHAYNSQLQKLYIKIMNGYKTSEIPIKRLLEEEIESPLYWTAVAEQLNRLDRFKDAQKLLEDKVMKTIPIDIRANFAYGLTLFNQEEYEKALKHLEFAFKFSVINYNRDPEYDIYLARCLAKNDRGDVALKILKWMVKADPDNEEAVRWLTRLVKDH